MFCVLQNTRVNRFAFVQSIHLVLLCNNKALIENIKSSNMISLPIATLRHWSQEHDSGYQGHRKL